MLTERALQFVHADVLFGHVRFDYFAVVHQEAGLALNIFSEAAIHARNLSYQVVQDEQRGGGDHASGERGVGTGHGVLHGVRKQEQQREIERSHLADLALAADADSDQHEKVDYSSAERDLEKRVRVGRQHLSYVVVVRSCRTGVSLGIGYELGEAVIGTGAFLGVLR